MEEKVGEEMKYYIREKLISLHHKFYVYDEAGKQAYEISSKVISIGDKTTLYDMRGEKYAYIEQRILHLMPHYDIYLDDHLVCSIAKKFQLIKNDYKLTNGYKVDGNFLALNFEITDPHGHIMGSIKRKFISIGDKYEIEIFDEKQELLALAILIAIANDVNRAQRNNAS